MDDPSAELIEALEQLAAVADEVTPEQAASEMDPGTLQEFWREWPRTSSWAGSLWRLLNADLAEAARPVSDSDHGETGGSG